MGAWREDIVEDGSTVKRCYTSINKAVHMGELLEICVQKHDELPDTPENAEKLKRTSIRDVLFTVVIVFAIKLARLHYFRNYILVPRL